MAKAQESSTRSTQKTHTAVQASSRFDFVSRIIRTICYGVWAVVGLLMAIALIVAMFGGGTLLQTLGGGGATSSEQAPAQPQQPPQPTEEQLGCVRDEVGEDRFNELQKGDAANQEENAKIQKCLQGK